MLLGVRDSVDRARHLAVDDHRHRDEDAHPGAAAHRIERRRWSCLEMRTRSTPWHSVPAAPRALLPDAANERPTSSPPAMTTPGGSSSRNPASVTSLGYRPDPASAARRAREGRIGRRGGGRASGRGGSTLSTARSSWADRLIRARSARWRCDGRRPGAPSADAFPEQTVSHLARERWRRSPRPADQLGLGLRISWFS